MNKNMNKLDINELRKKIDEKDSEIRKLFKERMDIVSKIHDYKKENNLATLDKTREDLVLNNIKDKYSNDKLLEYYLDLQELLMKLSKDYQNKKDTK